MVESSIKMSLKNKTLVKLNNAGFRINEKWLVQGVSLHVERGKIITFFFEVTSVSFSNVLHDIRFVYEEYM